MGFAARYTFADVKKREFRDHDGYYGVFTLKVNCVPVVVTSFIVYA